MSEVKAITHKRRKVRFFHLLVALLIIAAGVFTIYRIHLKHKLHSKIESLRAAGYPVTIKELEKKNPVPEGAENAADILLDAMENYYKEPNNEDITNLQTNIYSYDAPARTKPISKVTVAKLGQYLKKNEKALEILHEASLLKNSHYPENLNKRGGLQNVTNSIKLLNLQSVYFSEVGDSNSALRALLSSYNIADSCTSERMFVFHVARMYYCGQIVSTLKYILNQTDFRDEQLIKLKDVVTDALNISDFSNIVTVEMCRTFDVFNNDDNITLNIIPDNIALPVAQIYLFFYKHLGIVDRDRILYLDYMSRCIEAAKLPSQKRYSAMMNIKRPDGILSGIIPTFNRNIDIEKKVITSLQTVEAAIAVKRYYLTKNRLPETLQDLIPDFIDSVPVDPDGKELKYKKIDEGCIIYRERNGKININKPHPQNDYIQHGIQNLGVWFMIEDSKDSLQ
jgi:hypothetical protein